MKIFILLFILEIRLKSVASTHMMGSTNSQATAANGHMSVRPVQASLSTSVHSLPSSSNHTASNCVLNAQKSLNSRSVNTHTAVMYTSKTNFIYEKLNRQRLQLVDMLLKHGADKYLVGKLSNHNLEKLNRKSFMLLKKWCLFMFFTYIFFFKAE